MISLLKNYFQVVKFNLFNNKLSLFSNFLHEINYFLAKIIFKKNLNFNKAININSVNLKKKGFIILHNNNENEKNNFRELSLNISKFFDNEEHLIYQDNKISYLNPKSLNQSSLKKIFTKDVINCIENYYKSSFKIYSYHIYRTDFLRKDDEDSYLWHTDNSTRHSLKLMFYLDLVTKNEGAMEIIDTSNSKNIFKKGFHSRTQYDQFKDLLDLNINICEGNLGSVVIFKNSLNLHRAKKPLKKKRDVININIYPSMIRFSNYLEKNFDKEYFNSGFSLNPFTNKPQNKLKIEKVK